MDVVQLSKPSVTGKPVRVLVVANHDVLEDALVDLLGDEPRIELAGIARTVTGAVGRTRCEQPDLVLVDMDMPGSVGERVVTEIHGEMPHITKIGMTIRVDSTALSRIRSLGVDHHIPKGADVVDSMRGFLQK